MKEVFRARQDDGHTQVLYQLETEEYDWLLYNLSHLIGQVKDTGATLTVSARVTVHTDSDADSTPAPGQIAGVVHQKGIALGHESVEYQFSVRVDVPRA